MLKQSQCECEGMAAVRYRHTLTVQSPAGTPDAGGHPDLTDPDNWDSIGNIRANFITRGGREGRVFDQVSAEVTSIVETPWNNFSRSIHPNMRLLFGTRIFNIVSAFDVDESRQKVRIHITEVI